MPSISSFSTTSSSIIQINATISNESLYSYDREGAAIYIGIILIWYSIGIGLLLFLQIRPRTYQYQNFFDYHSNNKRMLSKTNPFAEYDDIQADIVTKQILNELRDPDRRKRLWKIYYSSKEKQNEPHSQYYQTITADSVTIGRINRKLADIHRMRRNSDENYCLSIDNVFRSKLISSLNDTTGVFNRRFSSPNRPITITNSKLETETNKQLTNEESTHIEQESIIPTTNGSRKQRHNKFFNRFTVEKVSDVNETKESTSKIDTVQ